LGRIGYPEDAAGLAAFLASSDAAYMTGQGVAAAFWFLDGRCI
jgi:NAD(P)-dependent dehydrogenase (short-subunit alcohol dehydrogenase family)